MELLERSGQRKAAHDRDAAIATLRDASGRLGDALARLARAGQEWTGSQAALAMDAAADSDPVTRVRHLGGTVTGTAKGRRGKLAGRAGGARGKVTGTARAVGDSVADTAHAARKTGLRVFDLALLVGFVVLRKRLQEREAGSQGSGTAGSGTAGTGEPSTT